MGPRKRQATWHSRRSRWPALAAIAAVALYVNEVSSAYLVAAGLVAHAMWGVYHHWANTIVTRSLAEFCFVLDTLLAAAIVVVTMSD